MEVTGCFVLEGPYGPGGLLSNLGTNVLRNQCPRELMSYGTNILGNLCPRRTNVPGTNVVGGSNVQGNQISLNQNVKYH